MTSVDAPTFNPYPFQRDGIDALCRFLTDPAGHRAALLADEPGLGKSCQAVLTMDRLGCRRSLVVCPASLRLNWAKEIALWAPQYSEVQVLRTGKDIVSKTAQVVITSYNLACRAPLYDALASQRWDMIVYDEAHCLRSVESQVSRVCVVTLWRQAHYRLPMTGTPIPNGRAAEAWPLFSRLRPDLWGHFPPYRDRYCGEPVETKYGRKYLRSKNLEELGRIARESFMVRREQAKVLKELPPLVRQNVPLDIPELQVLEAQEGILDLSAVVRAIDAGNLPSADDPVSTARRKIGALKAPYALEFITDLLEEVPHAVVICHHRDVWQALMAGLVAAGLSVVGVNGTMAQTERQAAVEAFQRGEAQVFLGSLGAVKEGLTLTRADTTVMVEWEWVPSVNTQAEKRTHRIGQERLCRVFYLVAPNSLDAMVLKVLQRKQRDIEKVMAP